MTANETKVDEIDPNAVLVDPQAPVINFEDATPVKRPFSGGKQAAPNPYAKVIGEIALKTTDTGDAVAKRFVLTHADADAVKTDQARATRQLTAAGRANEPKVTVRVVFDDVSTDEQLKPGTPKVRVHKTRVTFWTVKPYRGKTADKADDASKTAEKSDDVDKTPSE